MRLIGCVAVRGSGTIADVLVENRHVVSSSCGGRCLARRRSRVSATPTDVPTSLSSTTMQNIVWIYHFMSMSGILNDVLCFYHLSSKYFQRKTILANKSANWKKIKMTQFLKKSERLLTWVSIFLMLGNFPYLW